jgi:hypothetical protein
MAVAVAVVTRAVPAAVSAVVAAGTRVVAVAAQVSALVSDVAALVAHATVPVSRVAAAPAVVAALEASGRVPGVGASPVAAPVPVGAAGVGSAASVLSARLGDLGQRQREDGDRQQPGPSLVSSAHGDTPRAVQCAAPPHPTA